MNIPPNPSISPSTKSKSISLNAQNIDLFFNKTNSSENKIKSSKDNYKKSALDLTYKSKKDYKMEEKNQQLKAKISHKCNYKMHTKNAKSIKNKHKCTEKNYKLTPTIIESKISKEESAPMPEITWNSNNKLNNFEKSASYKKEDSHKWDLTDTQVSPPKTKG